MRAAAVALLMLGLSAWMAVGVGAQSPPAPLVSDRPGFYCGSQALLPGVVHLETGVAFDRLEENSSRVDALVTPVVVRFGVVDSLEFRVSVAGVPRLEEGPATGRRVSSSGISSPSVGLKWNFEKGGESFREPSLGFLFSVNLPAGSKGFRPDEPEPTLNFASDFSLDDRTSLTTNIGVNFPFDAAADEYFGELFFAAALGRSVTPRTAWFVEIAGSAPRLEGSQAAILADGGVTYLVSNDLQLDLSLTRGLTSAASDWIVAGGISIRFD